MAGKPKTLTAAQAAEVETLAAVLTAQQVADYFGIGRTTFFAMMEREPGIAARYKKGKARAVGAIAQSLIQKARGGDTACMIFYLKTQAGWRETTAIEHQAPDGVGALLKSIAENGARLGVPPGGHLDDRLAISDRMDVEALPSGASVRRGAR